MRPKFGRSIGTPYKSPLKPLRIFMPPKMMDRLVAEANRQSVNPSILMMRALRNEFLSDNPFNHPIPDISAALYDENSQSPYAPKLFVFIDKYPGLSLDHLLFLKEDIGIPTDEDVLLALRDLTSGDQPMIEAYHPKDRKGVTKPYESFRVHRKIKVLKKEESLKQVLGRAARLLDKDEGVLE